jgi:hypothetical protein
MSRSARVWKTRRLLNGGLLRLPKRTQDYPNCERLALRFDRFQAAA